MRNSPQHDCDRVLYSSAFRRLGGVTQVVSAAEGDIFHNRLTHSLKVAQIGRRIAEKLAKTQADRAEAVGLNPDVVEAAGLAHDLGHPPFGHIAEDELNRLVGDRYGGFEGNPQTFRILSRLAIRSPVYGGLNLTRATLNATIKYPWLRDSSNPHRGKKWAAYATEIRDFEFARAATPGERRSAEAELMDWSDDITYAVHDVEDFYRAGMLPLERLREETEQRRFLDEVYERWRLRGEREKVDRKRAEIIAAELLGEAPLEEPFNGSRDQRALLRAWTASLIGRCVDATTLGNDDAAPVVVNPRIRENVEILKQLTWHYVILNPALAAQQHGQRRIVEDLFDALSGAARAQPGDWQRSLIPLGFSDQLTAIDQATSEDASALQARLAADIIAGMTEQQAIETHHRLAGWESGTVTRGSGLFGLRA